MFDIIIKVFDYIGTIAFAISGALKAIKYRLDIFGVIVLGTITAVFGGIVRDIIMNKKPFCFENEEYLIIAIISSAFTFLFLHNKKVIQKPLVLFDAIGLATFSFIGSVISLKSGYGLVSTSIIAVINGSGGGIMRDIMVRELPFVLSQEVYATVCILVAIMIWTNTKLSLISNYIAYPITITIAIIIRLLSVKYNINLPRVKG